MVWIYSFSKSTVWKSRLLFMRVYSAWRSSRSTTTPNRRGRGVHFFVGVEDVDQFYDKLIANGADVLPPVDEGWGGRFVTLEDPDKYRYFFVTWMRNEVTNVRTAP